MEEATTTCICGNCGTMIVNIATVKDEDGNTYTIGLDCKATLFGEDKDKASRKKRSLSEQFLKCCFNKRYKVEYDMPDIVIRDMEKPIDNFPERMGKIIFMEDARTLVSCGIEQAFIQRVLNWKSK